MMSGDWRSYDGIADQYDELWSARFEQVGRQIRAVVGPKPEDRLLDLGTGTGIVPRVFSERADAPRVMLGCDRAIGMLRRARARAAGLHLIAADAAMLPFRQDAFDVVTASFVLSHVADYAAALAEIRRILKPGGTIAVSNWSPPSDPYMPTWNACLSTAISKGEVERAVAEVVPWEDYFSQDGRLEAALADAGFARTASHPIDLEWEFTVEQFLRDRELSATGRLSRHLLGGDGWAQLRTSARELFHTRFGPSFSYRRRALVITAEKPFEGAA